MNFLKSVNDCCKLRGQNLRQKLLHESDSAWSYTHSCVNSYARYIISGYRSELQSVLHQQILEANQWPWKLWSKPPLPRRCGNDPRSGYWLIIRWNLQMWGVTRMRSVVDPRARSQCALWAGDRYDRVGRTRSDWDLRSTRVLGRETGTICVAQISNLRAK